jgi:hypothetical protein
MYKSNHSHRGSALIVGMIIVVLLSILTTSFLEKVLNLWKTSGWIKSSAESYALATWLIEEQLIDSNMTKESPWNIKERRDGPVLMNSTGRVLYASTGWTTMPIPGKWNSSFDSNWNIIGIGDPIQIVIPASIDWSAVNFYFRVPSIPGETDATGSVSSSGIILWTFGYSGASLYASGETNIFKFNEINGTALQIGWFQGQTNTGSISSFDFFYSDASGVGPAWSKCLWYQCTLKLSMIRPYVTTGLKVYPFLEYQIVFPVSIPSQYMVIDSSAYINGFLRSRQIRIPQITTNTATDFAILQ